MKNKSFIKKLLACSILSGIASSASATSYYHPLVKVDGNISDFGAVSGTIIPAPPFPTAPAGIPTQMQYVSPYTGSSFFSDPSNIAKFSTSSGITFLQNNPSTTDLINEMYNVWGIYNETDWEDWENRDLYSDWFYDENWMYSEDGEGRNNYATATKNYMTSSAFITYLQSSGVQNGAGSDSITVPGSGTDTLGGEFPIKFLGDHTININSLYTDPYMASESEPYNIRSIDLNGTNSQINISKDLVLGSVVDNTGGGSMNISVDGAFLILSGEHIENIAEGGFLSTENTYQGVNIDFQNTTDSALIISNNNYYTPLIFKGALLNTSKTILMVSNKFTINNNNPTIEFKSITNSPEDNQSTLIIDNSGITTTITSEWGDSIYDPEMMSSITLKPIRNLHAVTPVIVTDGSFGIYDNDNMIYPASMHIGYTDKDSSLTLKTESNEMNFGSPRFYSKNSALVFNNSNASASTEFNSRSGFYIGGSIYDNDMMYSYSQDLTGVIRLEAFGNKLKLKEEGPYGYGIGSSSYNRAKELAFLGDSEITVDMPVYAGRLLFNNSAPINMNNTVDLGDSANIDVIQDTTLNAGSNFSAYSPIIDVNNRNLNIASGTVSITGNASILTDFSSADNNHGKISIGGGAASAALDLSGLDNLEITFTADIANEHLLQNMDDLNDPLKEYSLKLFNELENGTFNDISDPNNVTLKSTSPNLFVTWVYDDETHSLKSTTNTDGLEDFIKANAEALPDNVQQIGNAISASIAAIATPDVTITDTKNNAARSDAIKAANISSSIIQLISEGAESDAEFIETLKTLAEGTGNIDQDLGNFESNAAINDRVMTSVATSQIFTPSFAPSNTNIAPTIAPPVTNIPATVGVTTPTTSGNVNIPASGATAPASPGTQAPAAPANTPSGTGINTQTGTTDTSANQEVVAEADATPLGLGIAAGDDLSTKYGVWFSPFYQKGIQRKDGLDNGYKVTNHGGIFGVDYKINEDTTIGFAWSNIKSNLKQTDAKLGSKAVTKSNIFSIYGALELQKNYFITGIASYGISNIRNSEKRPLTSKKFEFAKSKYKTQSYSAQLLGGRNIPFKKNFLFTPLAGIKYAEFHDDAYKETGTRFQNYGVSKKKLSQFDAMLGAKITYNTFYKDYNISPHLGGMAHINLKDNPPTTYISSEAFLNTIRVKGDKRSKKAWYTIDVGVDWSKDNMEYSISYENQIDTKYVGHQAKMKIKVNL